MCFLILLTLFSSVASAAEKLMAVTELFPPYQQLDDDNGLSGYTLDIVNRLTAATGDELHIDLLPWSVAYKRALNRPDLMIFSIGKNVERTELFHWIGPVATESLYFWALPSADIAYSDRLSDFRPYRISVVKDATTHHYLIKQGFEGLYVMGSTDSNAGEKHRISMLINARADIVISTTQAIQVALRELQLPDDYLVKVHRANALDTDLYIGFNKHSRPDIVKRYQRAMAGLISSGEFQKIKNKWKLP